MAGYKRPKKRLHREFLYLDHGTILNSLSALEAGKVDEIILKTSEAREGGIGIGVATGVVKADAGRKKQANVSEELVRTRTWFSAFDAWHNYLREENALGYLDSWDVETRDELEVGDTVEFRAEVSLSPIQKVFAAYHSFSESVGKPGSIFPTSNQEAAGIKKMAKMLGQFDGGSAGDMNLRIHIRPLGVAIPRVVARMESAYVIGSVEQVEGSYTVIGQVDAMLKQGEKASVTRIFKGSPAVPIEHDVMEEALRNFVEPSKALGVEIAETDLVYAAPDVMLRPVAIFR